jgi:hypothetical protein
VKARAMRASAKKGPVDGRDKDPSALRGDWGAARAP